MNKKDISKMYIKVLPKKEYQPNAITIALYEDSIGIPDKIYCLEMNGIITRFKDYQDRNSFILKHYKLIS